MTLDIFLEMHSCIMLRETLAQYRISWMLVFLKKSQPHIYGKEIRSCLEIFGINSFKEESTKESENLHVSEEIACSSDEDVESIYNRAIFDLDIRTVHALQKMRRMYDDFDTYFAALTSNDNEFWLLFEKLPAVGKKSLERARNFALSLTSEVVANDIMG